MLEKCTQTLIQHKEGICFSAPFGKNISDGTKQLIIKSKLFKKEVDKLLYLIQDNLCYGIIKLKYPFKITSKEFKELEPKHGISEDEYKRWWPYKQVLFAYEFDIVTKFNNPRQVEVITLDEDGFIRDFEYKLIQEELIKDIKSYNPNNSTNEQLVDDWRIVNAWYSTKKSGGNIKFSVEDIINLASMIYREIVKRVNDNKMKHEFNPDKMESTSRELYGIVSKGKTGITNSEPPKYDLKDPNLLNEFADKTLIDNFICVMGSYVTQGEDYIPNDLDILIKMQNPPEYLKRAIEVRICKDIGFSDKIHFTWGDLEGPHDSFIPIYNLQLKKISPLKRVTMQEELLTAELFYPMKPSKRFYQVPELIDYMFKDSNLKYAVEKKYNGMRALLYKTGNKVSIYSDNKKDISKHFSSIVNEAARVASKDYIIDGEIVYGEGGRSELIKFVVGTNNLDDSKIQFQAFDIIKYGDDISNKEWSERKQILHSMNFTNHIKEVHSIIVENKDSAEKAVKLLRNMKGSEGAMIKKYDGIYTKNGETDDWIKFRNEDTIIAKVVDVSKKENGFSYLIGIEAPNIANEKFVKDGKLILGNTFVTNKEIPIGDNVEVNIEEVWRHTYPDKTIRYSIHKPKIIGKSIKEITSWKYLDDLAVSKGEEVIENSQQFNETTTSSPGISEIQGKEIKKYIKQKPKYLSEYIIENQDIESEDTRSSAAKKFWESNWQNMYPKDGKGKFVYQHHFRGLNEDETNKSNDELMKTNHSVHGDFRAEISSEELFGFTVFLGSAQENREKDGDKLIYESNNKKSPTKLEGSFKLSNPYEWLDVGKGNGTVSKPQKVGATQHKYAKFFVIDNGTYEIGVWRGHMIELFLNGSQLKGRAIIQYAPVGENGQRKWLIDFPNDQKPYAESHDKKDVINELKSKNQKWLIWGKPGEKPEKINIDEVGKDGK